jgi:hypothetical protein
VRKAASVSVVRAVVIIVVDMATPLGTEATRCCLLTPQRTTVAGCDSGLELLEVGG